MTTASVTIKPLTIKMQTPLHVGTGMRRGLIHRAIRRDHDGNVYLPASSIKGAVRHTCEALLPTVGLSACAAPYPEAMHACRENGCLACRVFGAPGAPSNLFWHDARLEHAFHGDQRGQTMTRTQIQVSRMRGIAAEAHLYTSEMTASHLHFVAEYGVSGYMDLTPVPDLQDVYYELVLVLSGLRLVSAVGGEVSRGLGHCEIKLPDTFFIDDRELSVSTHLEALEHLKHWEGGLNNA